MLTRMFSVFFAFGMALSAGAAVEVPDKYRIELKQVTWQAVNTLSGTSYWQKGDGSEKWPNRMGHIDATSITYGRNAYDIKKFSVDDKGVAKITFELGVLTMKPTGGEDGYRCEMYERATGQSTVFLINDHKER